MIGFQKVFFPDREDGVRVNLRKAIIECVLATTFVSITFAFGVWYVAGITLVLLVYARSIYTLKKNLSIVMNEVDQSEIERYSGKPYLIDFLSLVLLPMIIPCALFLAFPHISLIIEYCRYAVMSCLDMIPLYQLYPVYVYFKGHGMIQNTVDQSLLMMHVNSLILLYFGTLIGCCSLVIKKNRTIILSWAKLYSKKSRLNKRNWLSMGVFGVFYPLFLSSPFLFSLEGYADLFILTIAYLIGSCSFYIIIFLFSSSNKAQDS